jgi:pimeloyl-ACP methyl ester carboxylesterase
MPTTTAADQATPATSSTFQTIELTAGVIDYQDTGGAGPAVLLLHGLLMDASLWDDVVAHLSRDHRCVVPTLPLGAHRHAMAADADLSLEGVARLVGELMDRLDLQDVTIVGVDTGGAIVQLMMAQRPPRIARAVLVSCDAFDNFPPGMTGKTLVLAGKLSPALFGLFIQQLRLRFVRRLPIAFGWLTKRGDDVTRRWLGPLLEQPAIRQDTVRVLREISANRRLLVDTAQRLPSFEPPVLIVWSERDRVMPPEHAHRLGELLPHAHVVEVPDTYTLIPLDQPERLAGLIGEFADVPSPGTDPRGAR